MENSKIPLFYSRIKKTKKMEKNNTNTQPPGTNGSTKKGATEKIPLQPLRIGIVYNEANREDLEFYRNLRYNA